MILFYDFVAAAGVAGRARAQRQGAEGDCHVSGVAGGKHQESDLQNKQKQHKNKVSPRIFLSPGARDDQRSQEK